jgi:hypothetical protein
MVKQNQGPLASARLLRLSLSVGAAIGVILTLAASSSAATPLERTAGVAGSLLSPVREVPASLPSLPVQVSLPVPKPVVPVADPETVSPSSLPQIPVTTPSAKSPITTPSVKSPVNAGPTPPISAATSNSGGELPQAKGPGLSVNESSAPSTPGNGGHQPGAVAGSGTLGGGQASVTASPGAPSHEASVRDSSTGLAEALPLRRWIIHVWPAVALGPAEKLLLAIKSGWESAVLFSQSGSTLSPPQVAASAEAGGSPSAPAPSSSSPIGAPNLPTAGGDLSIFILIAAFAGLLACLVYSVKREVNAADRGGR